MLINEVTEQQVDEYRLLRQYNGQQHIERGNRIRTRLKQVQTPLTDIEVRYDQDGLYHDYYLYSKQTKQCIGLFTIEEQYRNLEFVKPGISVVTPHMVLAPAAQRQGITTRAYNTFLRGGPWVFATDSHTESAARLWDSLAQGDMVTFYVNLSSGQVVERPGRNDLRVLGLRDRFRL